MLLLVGQLEVGLWREVVCEPEVTETPVGEWNGKWKTPYRSLGSFPVTSSLYQIQHVTD